MLRLAERGSGAARNADELLNTHLSRRKRRKHPSEQQFIHVPSTETVSSNLKPLPSPSFKIFKPFHTNKIPSAKTYIQENYDTQGIASKLTFFPPALPPYDGTYCFEVNFIQELSEAKRRCIARSRRCARHRHRHRCLHIIVASLLLHSPLPQKLPNHSNLYTLKIHSLLPPSPSTTFPSPSNLQTLGHIHNSHSLSLTFPTSGPLKNITLLSHGNASDVGTMIYRCERLCEASGGVVVGWDYRGYGDSKGETTTEWEVRVFGLPFCFYEHDELNDVHFDLVLVVLMAPSYSRPRNAPR